MEIVKYEKKTHAEWKKICYRNWTGYLLVGDSLGSTKSPRVGLIIKDDGSTMDIQWFDIPLKSRWVSYFSAKLALCDMSWWEVYSPGGSL